MENCHKFSLDILSYIYTNVRFFKSCVNLAGNPTIVPGIPLCRHASRLCASAQSASTSSCFVHVVSIKTNCTVNIMSLLYRQALHALRWHRLLQWHQVLSSSKPLQHNQDRKHRTYVYTLIVTETLEDWEDSVNIGMSLGLSHILSPCYQYFPTNYAACITWTKTLLHSAMTGENTLNL